MTLIPEEQLAPPAGVAVRTVMRNTTYVLAGQLLLKILALGFNVYMVRYLGDTGLGRYAAAIAYVAVFAMLTDFGATTYSVREMARREGAVSLLVSDILALRLVLSVLVVAALTATAPLLNSRALQPPGHLRGQPEPGRLCLSGRAQRGVHRP